MYYVFKWMLDILIFRNDKRYYDMHSKLILNFVTCNTCTNWLFPMQSNHPYFQFAMLFLLVTHKLIDFHVLTQVNNNSLNFLQHPTQPLLTINEYQSSSCCIATIQLIQFHHFNVELIACQNVWIISIIDSKTKL